MVCNLVKRSIILFHPRTLHEKKYRYYHVPYSLLAIATVIDTEKYNIVIIDDNVYKNDSYFDVLKEHKDSLFCVGISSMIGAQITHGLLFAQEVRNFDKKIPIVWGGALPTILPELIESSELCDVAIMGQGERVWQELIERFENNKPYIDIDGIAYKDSSADVVVNARKELEDVNLFPPYSTVYKLLDLNNYIRFDEHISDRVISYHSSQGCPYGCGYCAEVSLWHRKWSGFAVDRMIKDISFLVDNYDINGIKFYDSEFFIDKSRSMELAKRFISEGFNLKWAASAHPKSICDMTNEELEILKRSGLTRLLIGAESGSAEELKLIKKSIDADMIFNISRRCAKHGIFVCFTFVTGYPSMQSKNIENAFEFVKKLKDYEPSHEIKLHFYGPYPGTPLYDLALDSGFIPPNTLEGWAEHDYYNILTPWVEEKYHPMLRHFNEEYYPYISHLKTT